MRRICRNKYGAGHCVAGAGPASLEIGERRWSMLDESAQEWIMGESMRERWEPGEVEMMLHGWVQRG